MFDDRTCYQQSFTAERSVMLGWAGLERNPCLQLEPFTVDTQLLMLAGGGGFSSTE